MMTTANPLDNTQKPIRKSEDDKPATSLDMGAGHRSSSKQLQDHQLTTTAQIHPRISITHHLLHSLELHLFGAEIQDSDKCWECCS
ncbi:hypothetical protein R3W88_001879 [Solanum pinnatisectum]|uniref:Uncharacterized protein n=1 Tax=Solanum pinnatisectum TaxID=50273 RepID=A0AAV9MLE7_9SOLN|nr:hypothetical protein R3W88_001879 [Solanum pinnatisectum]